MTLWFVGAGISWLDSLPKRGAAVLAEADIIYADMFTSPIPPAASAGRQDANMFPHDEIMKLAKTRCSIIEARRWMVEDGGEILDNAEKPGYNVVLLTYGDPLVATTHTELMCRAKRRGIAVQTIHASSSPTSVVGECGLHHYKMGRMATIMRDQASMISPYYIIYKNSIESEHTLLLLEYDREGTEYGDGQSFFLDPVAALKGLAAAESGQRRRVVLDDTYAIVASRVGFGDQHITAGTVSSLVGRRGGFGDPPHTIIIPGRLHFTEVEALEMLAECIDPPPPSSEPGICVPRRIADQMVEKYAPLIRRSIEETRESCTGDARLIDILDNAGRYVSDAEDFVKKDGHADVAVLSIGYADGLVDALRQVSDIGFRGES